METSCKVEMKDSWTENGVERVTVDNVDASSVPPEVWAPLAPSAPMASLDQELPSPCVSLKTDTSPCKIQLPSRPISAPIRLFDAEEDEEPAETGPRSYLVTRVLEYLSDSEEYLFTMAKQPPTQTHRAHKSLFKNSGLAMFVHLQPCWTRPSTNITTQATCCIKRTVVPPVEDETKRRKRSTSERDGTGKDTDEGMWYWTKEHAGKRISWRPTAPPRPRQISIDGL
ncbi:hypothetical protein DFS34DRAFT_624968 [Phlyctochytrium arcticum]|nr:hypothetical protein DFS34DRAFT_624968 [Phlyctochytrium arcticum]